MNDQPDSGTQAATPEQLLRSQELSIPDTPPSTPTSERYELQGVIAKGGMGSIHRAWDRVLERFVAVKQLLGETNSFAKKRFDYEARITGQLQHPNIPPIYDLGTLRDGSPFLAMKLIEGRTLSDLLKTDGHGSSRWLAAFESICQAVGYAHQRGVIHRDLKPLNVMVGAFGEVQVMDWGLAKKLSTAPRESAKTQVIPSLAEPTVHETLAHHRTPTGTLVQTSSPSESTDDADDSTKAGAIMGTPSYMAPEQARGDIDAIDRRADVFALGAILCELLTGKPPLSGGGGVSEILSASAAGRFEEALQRLDACGDDPVLITLAKNCLSFEANDRPADASEVATAVAKFRAEADARAKELERQQAQAEVKASEERKRRRVMAWGTVAVVAVSLVGSAVSWMLKKRADTANEATATQLVMTNQQKERAEKATEETKQALAEVQKASDVVFDIFEGFDIRQVKAGTEPVESVLAKRLIEAGKRLNAETIRDLETLAVLQNRLGATLSSLGYANEAINLVQNAIPKYIEVYGPEHHNTLKCQANLALALARDDRWDTALPLCEQLLDRMKAKVGPDHRDTLVLMNAVALGWLETRQIGKAIPLLERTFQQKKVTLGQDHPETLSGMKNLALGYLHSGQVGKALPLLDEALALSIAKLGPTHSETLNSMGLLAGAYRDSGQLAKAVPLLEKVLAHQESTLGSEHPSTLQSMANLAGCFWSLRRLDRSIPLFENSLSRQEKKLGRNHPDTITTIANLGVNYRDVGWIEQAVPLLEEAYFASDKHPQLKWVGVTLLKAYQETQRVTDATKLSRELLTDARATLPMNSSKLATVLSENGLILVKLQQYASAEPLLRECLMIAGKVAPNTTYHFYVRSLLGESLFGQQKYVEAEPLFLMAYEGLQKHTATLPAVGRNNLFNAGHRLIELYTATNRPELAAKIRTTLPREVAPSPRAGK